MYAVFPLNIVVLPNESVALHLFEPRYKQLFQDYKNGKEFAIVHQERSKMSSFGTLVRIEKIINEFPDETVDLIVVGTSVIQVNKFHQLFPNKLYSAVDAQVIVTSHSVSEALKEVYFEYLSMIGKKVNPENQLSIFQMANRLELAQETKNELIQQSSESSLNSFLINQIRFLMKIREQEGFLKQNFHLN